MLQTKTSFQLKKTSLMGLFFVYATVVMLFFVIALIWG